MNETDEMEWMNDMMRHDTHEILHMFGSFHTARIISKVMVSIDYRLFLETSSETLSAGQG